MISLSYMIKRNDMLKGVLVVAPSGSSQFAAIVGSLY